MRKLTSAVCGFCALAGLGAHAEFYATGGEVTLDGEYYVHTFTNASDTLTVHGSGEVEVLLVGGGGGGGAWGGGGGAGGQVISTTLDLTAGEYPIEVGAGGAGGVVTGEKRDSHAENGGVTTAFGLVAGGGGGGGTLSKGQDGANGGGGSVGTYKNSGTDVLQYAGGLSTNGVGSAGGTSYQYFGTHFCTYAGGGAGAGSAGFDATPGQTSSVGRGGHGGWGVTNSITGLAIGYGGGGGGGSGNTGEARAGEGRDGGGDGGYNGNSKGPLMGSAGEDGRGGGGGGGGRKTRDAADGGRGGCGTVIVRYKPTWPDRFEKIEVTGNYSYRRRKIDGVRYGLYTFTNDVSVKVTGSSYADLLLVGGGGGGGKSRAGGSGGGGGGVVETNRIEILGRDEPYVITIGAGGAGGGVVGGDARNGGDTMAFGLIAHGGGAGGRCDGTGSAASSCAGADGACGGGAAPLSNKERFPLVPGGKAIWPGEGFDGGCATNVQTARCWGGGGGGAGGPGGDGVGADTGRGYAGAGGVGRLCTITGIADAYYGGGGGGGQCCLWNAGLGNGGAGGLGGGGKGSGNDQIKVDGKNTPVSCSGFDGTDGLGGGGGGAGNNPNDVRAEVVGGTGGCGTVILRVREEEQGLMLLFR